MAILLKTASYHGDGAGYAALAAETRFLSYQISQEFNRPAIATIILNDVDGTMIRKYTPLESACYVGPGKAQIEDPTGTPVFQGRIVDASRRDDGKTVLIAEDWLSELNEERIDYDMREDLDGAGLRGSTLASVIGATCYPVYKVGAVKRVYDRIGGAGWAVGQWDGKYLIFPNSMVGNQTIGIGPYSDTVAPAIDSETGDYTDCWADDSDWHNMQSWTTGDFTVEYKFRIYVPRSTKLVSISAARVKCTYYSNNDVTPCWVEFYNHFTTAYIKVSNLATDATWHTTTWTIPGQYVTAAILTDANGEMWIRFSMDYPGALVQLVIDKIEVEVDVVTTGYSSVVTIVETAANTLIEGTDLTLTGEGLWEGCPYCIAKRIYKHIDFGEAVPGTLVTNGDALLELTCAGNIEHTTGISTRHYTKRTRLEIIKDLAEVDRAVFWIPVGTIEVYYKKTFNAGAPTALTDAMILSWAAGEYDYKPMRNECSVYGIRIGDEQVEATSSDATSITTYGRTRTQIVNDSGVICEVDASALGASIVAKDKDVKMNIEAELQGLNTTFKLGTEVAITSTILNLDGNGEADYFVVTKWVYDSRSWRTMIELKPRGTVGFTERAVFGQNIRTSMEQTKAHGIDIVSPDLTTHSWTNP